MLQLKIFSFGNIQSGARELISIHTSKIIYSRLSFQMPSHSTTLTSSLKHTLNNRAARYISIYTPELSIYLKQFYQQHNPYGPHISTLIHTTHTSC